MAVPAFYYFIYPILDAVKDRETHSLKEIKTATAIKLRLSEDDLQIRLPSGAKTQFDDRFHWALTDLRQALLTSSSMKGQICITDRGIEYLTRCPKIIQRKDLKEFPEFVAYLTKKNIKPAKNEAEEVTKATLSSNEPTVNEAIIVAETSSEETPREAIEDAFVQLNDALAQDLQEQLKSMPPARFEWVILQLMFSLGYGSASDQAGRVLGQSNDEGVDGVISEDKLGLEKIYLQAKRYKSQAVTRPEVQAFIGALVGKKSNKGVFMTTSTFSKGAREFAEQSGTFKISLIDGVELARLMIEYDLGVSLEKRYDVKRVDSDFFADG